MISRQIIKDLAKKFQSREENIVREYLQHLFLSYFYQQKKSERIFFKGGTALKILYNSPRFSEDLDFSSANFYQRKNLENLFINTLEKISKENIGIDLKEAKFTSGGYLGILFWRIYEFEGEIFFEVSFRKKRIEGETLTVISDYLPTYLVVALSPKEMVKEKSLALLERGKPRDYYDLYFILRHPILRKYLSQGTLLKIKENLTKVEINFKKELESLLPASHHQILKKFKSNLLNEIERFL